MFMLLTLEKQSDGVWVTRLVEELLSHLGATGGVVEIVSVETFLQEQPLDAVLGNCRGIINRVSDAADPVTYKKCLAILSAARLMQIPVFNGPTAYTLCANKWCHHMVFRRAGLAYPSSTVVLSSKLPSRPDEKLAQASQRLLPEPLPHLVKPNAGGFGAGIVKLVTDVDDPSILPLDDTLLLQSYVPPANGNVYRVWFLLGRVQCAVERTTAAAPTSDDHDDFTTGCAGNVCTIASKKTPLVSAWSVSTKVRQEIERILECLPEDAHAGSVEFLIDTTGQRLYFDLNLLSTLPVSVVNANTVWGELYNPWAELAEAVIQVLNKVERATV